MCGTSWKESKTLVVPDVDLFQGILPAVLFPVEIVVPVIREGIVVAVLDIDSSELKYI